MKALNRNNGKINIVQVVYDLRYGGSERLAAFLAYSMDRSKYNTCVLGLYGDGPISIELQRHRIPTTFFEGDNHRHSRYDLQKKLFRFLRENAVDILQVHGAYPFTRVVLMSMMTKTKIIYTEHAKKSLQSSPRLRLMTRISCRFCHKIVVVSDDLRRYFKSELRLDNKKVVVIHNGVDLRKFNPNMDIQTVRGLPKKSDHTIFVGIVGRLTDAKDHMGLLSAWAKVLNEAIEGKLIIVGDGELREVLHRRVDELGLGSDVVFLGQRNDIPQIISKMDLLILPSKREGFPISLLEYMAFRKPVIATNVGGVPEIIQHGENGYLIPSEDPDALADAMLYFLSHRDAFVSLAEAGRRTVLEKFSDRNIVERYEQLYRDVCFHPEI